MHYLLMSEKRFFSSLYVLLVLTIFVGCAQVRLVSDYDEFTDKSLTVIQQKTDDFIESLRMKAKTDEAAFDKHLEFYEEIDRDLRRLEFRVGSIPNNERTIKLVRDIRMVILGEGTCSEDESSLRSLHCLSENKDQGPSAKVLEIARRNINQTISAALNLELSKKNGSAQGK